MNVFVFVFMIVLMSTVVSANVVINEMMYNPGQCSDTFCEWVELYNPTNESVNMTGWTLCGDSLFGGYISHNDEGLNLETGMIMEPYQYALITDGGSGTDVYEMFSINQSALALHIDDSTLCGRQGLPNTESSVILSNGVYSDSVDYNTGWGANGNNYTLEKVNSTSINDQESWSISLIEGGTPGYINSAYGTGGLDYSGIKIVEFLPNPHGNDNAPAPQGEWIELYNGGEEEIDLQWAFFKDLQGHTIYVTDTTTAGTTVISPNEFLVVYINGFSGYLNNEGVEEITFYSKEGALIDKVSYGDSDEGSSWSKFENYWQKTKPTANEKNVEYNSVKDSAFTIEKIQDLGKDNIAKFGQTIRVKVNAYKGDETKSVLRMFVSEGNERISKESKITISTKYMPLELAVPIQLYPNCNSKYDEGKYNVVIGWANKEDFFDSYPLDVEGITNNLCEKVRVAKESESTEGKFAYNLVLDEDKIEIGEQFEVMVEVQGDNKRHDIVVWTYVYRGPKTYSGDQEGNKKMFRLQPNEEKRVVFPISLDGDMEEGQYKLKVKLNKDNQKTNKEITKDITVIEGRAEIAHFQNFGENQIVVETENVIDGTVDLVSFFGEQRKQTNSTVMFNISLIEGNNIFFAKLIDEEDEIVDMAQLTLQKEGDEVREVKELLEISEDGQSLLRDRLKSLRDIKGKRGRVVYESSSMKAKELVPWIFIASLVLLIGALVWKKI